MHIRLKCGAKCTACCQNGGATHLLGFVYKKRDQYGLGEIAGAGIRVVAEQRGQKLEAFSNDLGQFDFAEIPTGVWQLRVDSPGMVHSSEWPEGPPEIRQHGCAVRYLSAASDERILGIVRGADGKPIPGIPVQAFVFDNRGQLETLKFREALTRLDGTYEIDALPSQEYVVGINAEKYHDRIAYSPLFYPQTSDRNSAARIKLGEMEHKPGIDFAVGRPREPAILLIEGVYEDGRQAPEFGANIEDAAGIQRAFADPKAVSNSLLRVSVWAGETYRVKAWEFAVYAAGMDRKSRLMIDEWKGEAGPVLLTETGARVRVVLRRVQK